MELDVREIERVFGLKASDWRGVLKRNLARGVRPDGTSLAIAGYPELHSLTFFLTRDVAARLDAGGVLEQPAGGGAVLIQRGTWEKRASFVTVIGRDAGVLEEIQRRNPKGDVTPPWAVFPEYDSFSGFWRQGGEPWMTQEFRPFWEKLAPEERSAYLERWEASDEWREFLDRL